MPRQKRLCPEQNAFHIFARSNNRINFGLDTELLWDIFSDHLFFIHHAFDVKIHAFTLMSNHIHLLCSFPKQNISEALYYFMKSTSNSINVEKKAINHVYGGRYKSTLITKPFHFAVAYKYVLQNPKRANLTKNLIHYKYTTLSSIYGSHYSIIPISKHFDGLDEFVPEYGKTHIDWLHSEYATVDNSRIKKALKKSTFCFEKNNSNGKVEEFSSF